MLGLKLNHVSKRGAGRQQTCYWPGRMEKFGLSTECWDYYFVVLTSYALERLSPDAILTSKNASQERSCLSVLKCPRWSIGCLGVHLVQFILPSFFLRSTHNRHPIMMTSWHGNAFHITGRPLQGGPPVIDGFPYKRPAMRCFGVLFGVGLNELLSRITDVLRHKDAHVTSLMTYRLCTVLTPDTPYLVRHSQACGFFCG